MTRSRRRKDLVRLEIPARTDEILQSRVHIEQEIRRFVQPWIIEVIVRAAYIQGAVDTLLIAEHHPSLLSLGSLGPIAPASLGGLESVLQVADSKGQNEPFPGDLPGPYQLSG